MKCEKDWVCSNYLVAVALKRRIAKNTHIRTLSEQNKYFCDMHHEASIVDTPDTIVHKQQRKNS